MRAFTIVIAACAVLIGSGVVVLLLQGENTQPQTQSQTQEASMTCTDGNLAFAMSALSDIFADKLPADAIGDVACVKTAFSSDLFALAQINVDADLASLSLGAPDSWQSTRLNAAFDLFPNLIPNPKDVTPQVASGFTQDRKKIAVIADFGAAGRFVYFEL